MIITFVTYEGPWFRCGGIAAVMNHLPDAVCSIADAPTIVIAPFHVSTHPNNGILSLPVAAVGTVSVPYYGATFPVTVYRHNYQNVPWYFLKAVEQVPEGGVPFFAGNRHPYDLPGATLFRDSFFFGQAVVQSLGLIAGDINPGAPITWQMIVQDWEGATAALAFASQNIHRGKLFLTLHNSYDVYDPLWGDTVLNRTLSLVQWPVFTVSEQFAVDFTDDLLQREVMASHLQKALREKQVLGVDNGPFKTLALPANILSQSARGNHAPLREWKAQQKRKALEELARPLPGNIDLWGNVDKFRKDNSPWIVMAGRDDPRQKGYDVAAAAVVSYLEQRSGQSGCAQFIFFPILGDEGADGLVFLRTLANKFPEDVLVFLGRWDAGFAATLRGSAYALMPSLYEPFGMANEFYLDGGCVGIGRATGGNLQQIVPLRAAAAFSQAVQIRAKRYHLMSADPTGILFREKDDIPTALKDWNGINKADYRKDGSSPTRVQERQKYPLFQDMADELRIAIEDGIRVYTQEPELYYRMLTAGIAHIQRVFSWHRAGQEYIRYVK